MSPLIALAWIFSALLAWLLCMIGFLGVISFDSKTYLGRHYPRGLAWHPSPELCEKDTEELPITHALRRRTGDLVRAYYHYHTHGKDTFHG